MNRRVESTSVALIGPLQITLTREAPADLRDFADRADFDAVITTLSNQFAVHVGSAFSHFEPDPWVVLEAVAELPRVLRAEVTLVNASGVFSRGEGIAIRVRD